MIGVNTAGIDGADGIGFAIPAETVAEIVDELITYGAIERASLGVRIARNERFGNPPPSRSCCYRPAVSNPAGPFKPGDVLISIGGRQVESQHDLLRILRRERLPTGRSRRWSYATATKSPSNACLAAREPTERTDSQGCFWSPRGPDL